MKFLTIVTSLTLTLLASVQAAPVGALLRGSADSSKETEMYVDWHGVQFTDKNGEIVYEIRPPPKVPIIHSDFTVRNAKKQTVCMVRERILRLTHKWIMTCTDEKTGQDINASITFPFFRYTAKIIVNGKEYRIQGDFPRHQFEIISMADGVTHFESSLQSKLKLGAGMISDLYRLTVEEGFPAPVAVAIHRMGFLMQSGQGAESNRGAIGGAALGTAIGVASAFGSNN
jgi:uncharacterized protein YxjI